MHGADYILIATIVATELLAIYHNPKSRAEKLSAYRENRAQNIPMPEKEAPPTPLPKTEIDEIREAAQRTKQAKERIEAKRQLYDSIKLEINS